MKLHDTVRNYIRNRRAMAELRALDDRIEPHRVCRRPFGLSYAAMAGSSSMA